MSVLRTTTFDLADTCEPQTDATETYRERAIGNAKHCGKFESMLKILGNMETHDELKRAALLFFVPDMSYDRGDICLALKTLEMENRWGEYQPRAEAGS